MVNRIPFLGSLGGAENIGDVRLFLLSMFGVALLGSWLIQRGDYVPAILVLLWYAAGARTEYIGPYLGFERESWSEEESST
ncbi:MAG: hypothetical protein ABEJ55_07085 [Halanaeroarchaeum sp.]